MSPRSLFARYAGKWLSVLLKFAGVGAGVTWAGEVAGYIQPNLLKELASQTDTIILVSGTNGKTTTAAMIAYLLKQKKCTVIHNNSGANLRNGILGTYVTQYQKLKTTSKTIGVFEVDEAVLPTILTTVNPDIVVLLNLFRDQLDRYGEVNEIAHRWSTSLSGFANVHGNRTIFVAAADDPLVVSSLRHVDTSRVKWFGQESYKKVAVDEWADSISCPACGTRLEYTAYVYSHLGKWSCPSCSLKRPKLSFKGGRLPLLVTGEYNQYNASAALLVLYSLGYRTVTTDLKNFSPVFGRQESFVIQGTRIQIVLSKNPTGLNESIRAVLKQSNCGGIVLALNDRIPDGRDVSWIWDVDTDPLVKLGVPLVCTGDRAWDMAVRIKYSGKPAPIVVEDTGQALAYAIRETARSKTLYILPTYSAMLDIRKELTGKKLL